MFKRIINYCIIFLLLLTIFSFFQVKAQDIFISKYGIDRYAIASLAVLIYSSPIFNISESLKIYIKNNKKKFESLNDIFLKESSKEDFQLNIVPFDSSSASLKYKQINEILSGYNLDGFNFFLLDLADLLINKDDISNSLEKYFKEKVNENILFSKVQISLNTNENLFLHIKDTKKNIDHYIFFELGNLNNSLFELLSFVFKKRIFYTTILPKKVEFDRELQQKFNNITGRTFIYPEVENMLESLFLNYCISNQADIIQKYTGISLKDNINAISFYYKNSWINELLKSWDSIENSSVFKFPRPYGNLFLELLEKFELSFDYNSFNKIIELNSDLTCVLNFPLDLNLNIRKISLLEKKLKKIGFNKIILKSEYEKNIKQYSKEKIIMIYLLSPKSTNLSPFNINIKDNKIQLNQLLINSFSEISYISYFEKIEILLIVNKTSLDYLMKAIGLVPKLKGQPIVNNRNFFRRLLDRLISLISPLSL